MGAAGTMAGRGGWPVAAALILVALIVAGGAVGAPGLTARPTALAAVVAVAVWLSSRIAQRTALRVDPAGGLGVAALLAWVALSALWSSDVFEASRAVGRLLQCALIYLLVLDVVDSPRRLERVAAAAAVGAMLAASLVLVGALPGWLPFAPLIQRIVPRIEETKAVLAVAGALPLGVALFVCGRGVAVRLLGAVSGLFCALAVAESGSQGALAGTVAGLGVLLVATRRGVARRSGLTPLGALAVLGVAALAGGPSLPALLALGTTGEVTFAGVGAGPLLAGRASVSGIEAARAMVLELGLIGSGLLAVVWGRAVRAALGAGRSPESGAVSAAMGAALVGGLVAGATSGQLVAMPLWMLAGLASAAGRVSVAGRAFESEPAYARGPVLSAPH